MAERHFKGTQYGSVFSRPTSWFGLSGCGSWVRVLGLGGALGEGFREWPDGEKRDDVAALSKVAFTDAHTRLTMYQGACALAFFYMGYANILGRIYPDGP